MEPLSRRATLATGAGLAAATLAGCGDVRAQGAGAAPDPDLRLVREALRHELRVRERVRQLRRSPRLRAPLAEVAAVHRDHVDLLRRAVTDNGEGEVTVEPYRPEPGIADQVRRLAAAERGLADVHAAAALEARSGPLARVLAGLAAAGEQQAQVLDRLGPEVSRG